MRNNLFTPLQAGSIALPNRIVMAPMTHSRADMAGVPGSLVPTYYAQRSGAGLIISEGTYPSAMGKGYLGTPGLHADAQVAGWKTVTDAVHARGGQIVAQIMHAGRISDPSMLPDGATPVAPSAVRPKGQSYTLAGMKDHVTPRALVSLIGGKGLAYVHVALFGGPFDYHSSLRPLVQGAYFAGGGLTQQAAEALVVSGQADAAVFGAVFIANPDLPARFRTGAALAKPDQATYYAGGDKGYTDYPALAA